MEYGNCSICSSLAKEELINTELWWGEKLFVFKHLPACVCWKFGEQYFNSNIYDAMIQRAQSSFKPEEKLAIPVWDLAAYPCQKPA